MYLQKTVRVCGTLITPLHMQLELRLMFWVKVSIIMVDHYALPLFFVVLFR